MTASADLMVTDRLRPDPGLAIGRGLPDVPWTIRQEDRIYNQLLAGGQGSGKSSMLLRLAMADVLAPNTATILLDMKGSLTERLLRLTPPDIGKRWYDHERGCWQFGEKRVWYLDLGRPAFGLTPLRVEKGWTREGLADDFSRIADAMCRALLDLYPGQIMGSSEDLIERAVVGTMAIAWFEHTERCKELGVDPEREGFSGSFEVLAQMFSPTDRFDDAEAQHEGGRRRRTRANRWHQAAGRACERLPNLDQVADTLLYEIPRQARDNLGDIAKRMEAPANKIRPLVGAAASVRRFVGHPERLSLRSVIEAHDTLIVNPRMELIGEDQATILTNFIVHMLDLQLKRQLQHPASTRPRVSLVIDEAQRLVTDTLIRMVEAHREAGLTTAVAVQYVSQLGAYEPSSARREKILKGIGNLFQTKVLFRMSDSEDADRHTAIFRSVYETMVRADPTSRARMPFDPARMQTLRDHHALVSLVSSAEANGEHGLIDTGRGATRLQAFVTETFAMPDIEAISDAWRSVHLDRQDQVFTDYPEDMAELAVHDVPPGLGGEPPATEAPRGERADAHQVATETVGRTPEPPRYEARASDAETPPPAQAPPPSPQGEQPGTPEHDPALFRRPGQSDPRSIGGVDIERSQPAGQEPPAPLIATSPVLGVALQPTGRAMPAQDIPPGNARTQRAAQAAAVLESITTLSAWRQAGDEQRTKARAAADEAREQALAEAGGTDAAGSDGTRRAERRARRAAQDVLATAASAPWRTPPAELGLSDDDAHTLEVIARLQVVSPKLLAELLDEPASDRTVRERVTRLFDAGLIARADVGVAGRRGRPPALWTIAPRGLEYLRARRAQIAPEQDAPRYLTADRKFPTPGKGSGVPHELAIQVTLVALRQFGGRSGRMRWSTTRMPGGRWDVGMVHRDRRDRTLTRADLSPGPGYAVRGERLDAPAVLEPDASVQLEAPVDHGRGVIDMLLEVDRTGRGAYNASKFVAYDQFLGGWCLHTRRFGKERKTRPLVVFIARTSTAMLTLLRTADEAMTLGYGRRGTYDETAFDYPGRAHTAFTSLDWLLGGQAMALGLPDLPPQVRGTDTDLQPRKLALVPEVWWPSPERST